ncbi:diacylglycerol/lipid kinase family protein [Ilumatobacter sp.]|uniref:diacylglycerol/lipid kinase family protein n=1 Tax=Ilumatobacter sp. TaxID=1967498 RepID=UPI003B52DFE0
MTADPTIGVLINDGKQVAGEGLEHLRAALADAGRPDPPWREVSKSKKAPPAVVELIEELGVDRLLVWGGDGTVRRCVDTLLRAGHDHVTIGVLPAGTGNLLADNLGIPIDLRAAVDVALHGVPTAIDVGVVDVGAGADEQQHFVVMAGTGFDALLIEEADHGLKDRLGRLGYVWAGVRRRHVSSAQAIVTVDGSPWRTGAASSVIVGNVGRLIGGVPAFPAADPTDGRFEVGVIEVRGGLDWIRLFAAVYTRRVDRSPFVHVTTGERIVIELDRTLPWQVDGGGRDRADRFDITCLPGAIRICRPHHEPG